MYQYLESEGIDYAIRLPSNQILQAEIGHLLKRPVGRPAHYVQRFYKSFRYQAASGARPRRVVAKVEWHFGELFPRVGFIVTNLRYLPKNVVGFDNQRGTAEQCIKEWKGALKGTWLSCRSFNANAVRLQLHALAYNLGNFLRSLAIPKAIAEWSLTTLREKLIKIGAKWSATAGTSPFRWRRSQSRARCSLRSCRESLPCDRRRWRADPTRFVSGTTPKGWPISYRWNQAGRRGVRKSPEPFGAASKQRAIWGIPAKLK
jgi:Transposase DDE domain group 1